MINIAIIWHVCCILSILTWLNSAPVLLHPLQFSFSGFISRRLTCLHVALGKVVPDCWGRGGKLQCHMLSHHLMETSLSLGYCSFDPGLTTQALADDSESAWCSVVKQASGLARHSCCLQLGHTTLCDPRLSPAGSVSQTPKTCIITVESTQSSPQAHHWLLQQTQIEKKHHWRTVVRVSRCIQISRCIISLVLLTPASKLDNTVPTWTSLRPDLPDNLIFNLSLDVA
jgi:hypothetical protein